MHRHEPRPDLQRLIDGEHLDELLASVGLDEIGHAWRCFHERSTRDSGVSHDDDDWWAVEFWLAGGLGFRREDVARAGLIALVDASPDDLLEYVGAGPIESYIDADERIVAWVEGAAKQHRRFRQALSYVYLSQELPWVFDRLRNVLDDPASAR